MSDSLCDIGEPISLSFPNGHSTKPLSLMSNPNFHNTMRSHSLDLGKDFQISASSFQNSPKPKSSSIAMELSKNSRTSESSSPLKLGEEKMQF